MEFSEAQQVGSQTPFVEEMGWWLSPIAFWPEAGWGDLDPLVIVQVFAKQPSRLSCLGVLVASNVDEALEG